MSAKKHISGEIFTDERSLFCSKGAELENCVFTGGESPIKECSDIDIKDCIFRWRYPIWYSNNINAENSMMYEDARAAVWYTNNASFKSCTIDAPKTFRRCDGLIITDTAFTGAAETLWHCKNVKLSNVTAAKGDYFAMNSENMEIDNLTLQGKYSFDGVKNVTIRNSRFVTKDSFWNSENVTVYDSFISGEYIGWNAKNLTFVNCTLESLQGLCYIDNLVMKNCRLINTTLAFEYSSIDADIVGNITSVLNPKSGTLTADSIGELIVEKDRVDPKLTKIVCRNN